MDRTSFALLEAPIESAKNWRQARHKPPAAGQELLRPDWPLLAKFPFNPSPPRGFDRGGGAGLRAGNGSFAQFYNTTLRPWWCCRLSVRDGSGLQLHISPGFLGF